MLVRRRLPQIVKDVSVSAGGSYISTAATILRGFLLAKLLTPLGIGTLATVGLVIAYSLYADLGICQAAGRQISMASGQRREEEARLWPFYGLIAQVLGGLTISLAVLTVVIVRGRDLDGDLRFGLLTACLAVLLLSVTTAQQVILRAQRQFGRASLLMATSSVGNLVAAIVGAATAGVRGVFVAQVATYALSAVVGALLSARPVIVMPAWSKMRLLLRLGFPFAILSFGAYGLVYVDQVMILTYLGREALGIYTLALYAGSALFLFPGALAAAVTPRQLSRFGEFRTLESISNLTWTPVRVLSISLPLLISIVWILGPLLIESLLPLYQATIIPMRVYLVGIYFLGLNAGVGSVLLAINRHALNIPIVVGAIGLNVLLDILLMGQLNLGLAGAAVGSSLTYFLYWLASSGLVRWQFEPNLPRALKMNLKVGWPGLLPLSFALVSWRAGLISSSNPLFELLLVLASLLLLYTSKSFLQTISKAS